MVSIVSMKNTHDVSRIGLVSLIRNTERVGLFLLGTESISKCHMGDVGSTFHSQFYCCDPPGWHSATEHSSSAKVNSHLSSHFVALEISLISS